ncbi:Srb8p NDAI_0I00170 [Naumovozyma dairenensis CBS 421]|uniref:Mediator of RNA polymerase II transcription subunit 12 n=1 Tax=Naumovozyma dairenensis (strain ATCC 10597 / BCRC 20456 / CBS 421 / NBRC 0211 / NRRL Y-12639) TaxID=1071378 RepID=G0WFM5_NAUDC|nr:hypothetical protein NDAI_0I00170 [Naumovozyma dairenensis CBS 421]CCD26586.1 hypothetical protein NDAI_0I00170 [Naumovozyma dairenensis CBS 421]
MTPNKYILTPPEELYPYTGRTEKERNDDKSCIYPDFEAWSHTLEDDQILNKFVAKGYYTTSKVNFESISARSTLNKPLNTVSIQLANQFTKILQVREQEINRIPSKDKNSPNATTFFPLSGPYFSLPNRVTLTDHRKELWLQELSNPYVSLSKISKFIPHGLKRRQVLEQCYTKQIPLKRAIWLIKCCFSIEWKSLMTKASQTQADTNKQLLKEWTDNFIYILEKLIFEISQHYNDPNQMKNWKLQISYFLKLLGNSYTLQLLEKETFHHWLVEFVTKVENLKFLPLSLHILTTFWDGICQPIESADENGTATLTQPLFLVSKITDMLLQKYASISQSKSMINDERYIINDLKKNNKIKDSLLSTLKLLICKLFQEQSLEVFLFSAANWEIYKPYLYEATSLLNKTVEATTEVRKKLELISYSNEALKNGPSLVRVDDSENDVKLIMSPTTTGNNIHFDAIHLKYVDTKLTKKLDDNPTSFDWSSYIDQNDFQCSKVVQLILWSICPSRQMHYEAHQLVAKLLLLKINSVDGFPDFQIEDTIWTLVFQIAKLSERNKALRASLPSLSKLLNILITYGIIKVPTYIRKLISSGVLYLPNSNGKFVHCKILINLKISPLMKSQYNMVLRNVMEYDPTFFEKYNFDQLQRDAEDIRNNIANIDDLELDQCPLSVKTIIAEWYLSNLCSDTQSMVDKVRLLKNFKLFCIDLELSHHYYKWIEFIVYHQLLIDIEALETLMDILLCYEKVFSQFINDHILFTKTFIFIYRKVLRDKDNDTYMVTSFMPFWKFFKKNFMLALNIDNDLNIELTNVYEEEKQKQELLEKDQMEVQRIYNCINSNTSRKVWKFTEVFEGNVKLMITKQTSTEKRRLARRNLHLLMIANLRDYNKRMSVFLKRKYFQKEDLIRLVSNKLLTLGQIQSILGIEFIIPFLSLKTMDDGQYFEYHKEKYIESNFAVILTACENNFSQFYQLFLSLFVKYGMMTKLFSTAAKSLISLLKRNSSTSNVIMEDLLKYQIKEFTLQSDLKDEQNITSEGEDDDDHTIEEPKASDLYTNLDFSNLWIFQIFTCYQLNEMLELNNLDSNVNMFISEVVEITQYDNLCTRIFDQLKNTKIITTVIVVVERVFLERCLSQLVISNESLIFIIEVIETLSKKINKDSSGNIPMADDCYSLFQQTMSYFANLDINKLTDLESILDVFFKIFSIHQNPIFRLILNSLGGRISDRQEEEKFIDNMFTVFGKLTFNLRLKLMLYEILSGFKSYSIYVSTRSNEENNGEQTLVILDQDLITRKMSKLPPFQVSSFTKEPSDEDDDSKLTLGTQFIDINPTDNGNRANISQDGKSSKWFIYNKEEKTYVSVFKDEPYHNINNYQPDTNNSSNNSCLNLSLFEASFERKNPR